MSDSSFAARLIAWHADHGRHDLPWQQSRDPYRVWLSEIMLQQTQVATVIPYYRRFLAQLPRLADLAAAPQAEVMALWSGLGYYARARNLHRCAQVVMTEHGGEFPRQAEAIAALPGIGRSTAHAIADFCFDARLPILDGNVKRVLCRVLAIEGFPGAAQVERRLWLEAERLLPASKVATYIQAQMDLGAGICTRGRPKCDACPLAAICRAQLEGRQAELPQARPRRAIPLRHTRMLVLRARNRVWLEPRPPSGIWGGLLSLPELPEDQAVDKVALGVFLQRHYGCRLLSVAPAPTLMHTFSHFQLEIAPLICDVEAENRAAEGGGCWLDFDSLAQAALPAPVRKLLTSIV